MRAPWWLVVGWLSCCVAMGAEEPITTDWSLTPVAAPVPALRYRLLPPLIDQLPGDAAPHFRELNKRMTAAELKTLHELAEQSVDHLASELPQEELAKFFEQQRELIADLQRVARMQQCDWQLPVGKVPYMTLAFDDVIAVQKLAALLNLHARWRVSQHDFPGALASLQSSFAIAQHVSRAPPLMHALVAAVICNQALEVVGFWIQQPDAPSLYWALTALPQPLVNMEPSINAELAGFFYHDPALAKIERNQVLSLEEEIAAGEALSTVMLEQAGEKMTDSQKVGVLATSMTNYPAALAWMKKQGRSEAEMVKLGPKAVVGLYHIHTLREMRDEWGKWFALPVSERRAIPNDLAHRMTRILKQRNLLLPAILVQVVEAGLEPVMKADRNVVQLRTVEALRLYAKSNAGKWPATLADLKPLPVPLDPHTGEPLSYELDGETAVVTLPQWDTYRAKRIMRLTIAK